MPEKVYWAESRECFLVRREIKGKMEAFRCRKKKMRRKGVEHEVGLQKRRALHYLDTGERLQNPKDTTDESDNETPEEKEEESQREEHAMHEMTDAASDQTADGEESDKNKEENEEATQRD